MIELEKTCEYFGITEEEIKLPRGKQVFVRPRQFFANYMMPKINNLRLVGELINKDHSIISHYRNNHQGELKNDEYRQQWNKYLTFMNDGIVPLEALDEAGIIKKRDQKWIEVLTTYFGKSLNSTLMEKIEKDVLKEKL